MAFLALLSGYQQLNEGVNTVNVAISSSLSSLNSAVDKTLGDAMAAEKKWAGKRISIANATVLEVTKSVVVNKNWPQLLPP